MPPSKRRTYSQDTSPSISHNTVAILYWPLVLLRKKCTAQLPNPEVRGSLWFMPAILHIYIYTQKLLEIKNDSNWHMANAFNHKSQIIMSVVKT